MVVEPDGDAADGEPPATVPCGCRVSVYRVPSAVFASVTGLFTLSVSVGEPFAYEPPTTATRATEAETETSWNSGFAAGKFPPEVTDSLTPFTEMTAEVGGAVGGAGGVFGGLLVVPPPDDRPTTCRRRRAAAGPGAARVERILALEERERLQLARVGRRLHRVHEVRRERAGGRRGRSRGCHRASGRPEAPTASPRPEPE